eukprot:1757441-Pyramimonas_sp.AAC.1
MATCSDDLLRALRDFFSHVPPFWGDPVAVEWAFLEDLVFAASGFQGEVMDGADLLSELHAILEFCEDGAFAT